jgi:hypothetical protein
MQEMRTSEDLQRNFQGSLLLYEEKGEWVPIHIEAINSNGVMGVQYGDSRRGFKSTLTTFMQNVTLEVPELGWVRYNSHYYYLHRLMSRQYVRGLRMRLIGGMCYTNTAKLAPLQLSNHDLGMCYYKIANNKRGEGVLDRDFARIEEFLFFRGVSIGKFNRQGVCETPLSTIPDCPVDWVTRVPK